MASNQPFFLETRWTRCHGSIQRSRFMDGDAHITLAELEQSWYSWPEDEKLDFCQSFCCARVPERIEIFRFLIANGDYRTWMAITTSIVSALPSEEAIPILAKWCQGCPLGEGANFYAALASTGGPAAYPVLKSCIERYERSEALLDEKNLLVACDVLYCLQCLLGLKPDGEPLRSVYELLKKHPAQMIRERVEHFPKKYFESPASVPVDRDSSLSPEDQMLCEAWQTAGQELGIPVSAPLILEDGETQYHFAALVCHFGHPDKQKGLVLRAQPIIFNPDQNAVFDYVTSSNGYLLVTVAHHFLVFRAWAFKSFLDQFKWYGPEVEKPAWYRK